MAISDSTPRRKWPQDLSGMRFGRLTAIERDPDKAKTQWICRCDCGNTCSVRPHVLFYGQAKSCGCLSRERSSIRMTSHGMSRSPVYMCWSAMVMRGNGKSKEPCYTKGSIYVCQRWRESFEAFYEDMGDKPTSLHSLDRIDGNGGYSCGKCQECLERGDAMNCRWATKQEQSVNRSITHFVTYNGETLTLAEWSRKTGIHVTTLCSRLIRGWETEAALTKKPQKNPNASKKSSARMITHNGQSQSVAEWSRATGISSLVIWRRLRRGWSESDAVSIPMRKFR
jgi:hypothetical protein